MGITAAVIGCGFAARKIHIPALMQSGVRLIGIADIDKHALADTPDNIPKFRDYRDMLDRKPDLAAICTPDNLHAEMCIESAKRGINILVEKPLAISTSECAKVLNVLKRHSVQVCVMHNYKYFEPFLKLKSIIKEDAFGDLIASRIFFGHGMGAGSFPKAWTLNPKKSVPLPMHVMHPFYLLEWIFGRPKSVAGIKIGDGFYGQFETSNGTVHMDLCQLRERRKHLFKVDVNASTFSIEARDPPGFSWIGHNIRSDIALTVKSFAGQTIRLLKLLRAFPFNRQIQYSLGSSALLISKYVESLQKGLEPPVSINEASKAIECAEKYAKACNQRMKIDF